MWQPHFANKLPLSSTDVQALKRSLTRPQLEIYFTEKEFEKNCDSCNFIDSLVYYQANKAF